MKNLYKWLLPAVLIVAAGGFSAVSAQQQQYANAYAYWNFGGEVDDVVNVDQKIWIAQPAPGSQWVLMWSWAADPAHGGYFGFNTTADGKAQALFSLWNADKANGPSCREFGGEGTGWSCRLPFELSSEVVYKLRLARTKTDQGGVWWGGWIYEEGGEQYYLGEIRVKKQMDRIRGSSIMNFSEYYGDVVKKCSEVPFSILALAPPQANRQGDTEKYARTARRNGGSDPKSNPCQNGGEAQGSLFKVEPFDFAGANGSIIYFGGTRNEHAMPEGLALPGIE
ncbi:MAG: DUF3472 domain-containing protein [Acidobacteria bacterium]|nr:DUF3472 domain-containing protein [Acidobacteriota bacterium]